MTTKEMLFHELKRSYDHEEMSLLSDVRPWRWSDDCQANVRAPEHDVTIRHAHRQPSYWRLSILQILEHVAWCKVRYATQAFGEPAEPIPAFDGTLESVLRRLDAAQSYILECLHRIPDAKLSEPVPTQCHRERG